MAEKKIVLCDKALGDIGVPGGSWSGCFPGAVLKQNLGNNSTLSIGCTSLINIRELDMIWQKQDNETRYQEQDGEEGKRPEQGV